MNTAETQGIVEHAKSVYMERHDEGLDRIPDRGWSLIQKVTLAARFAATAAGSPARSAPRPTTRVTSSR